VTAAAAMLLLLQGCSALFQQRRGRDAPC
jgi:hypothetical protein